MRHRHLHVKILSAVALLLLALLALSTVQALETPATARASVTAAWQAVQARGGYHFSADVRQTTSPKASVTNVGRHSRTDSAHLEGSADFDAREMTFTLWSQGGAVLDSDSGAQVRIDDDGAYARHSGTSDWEPIPDFSAAFAPQGDFLAYLDGARQIEETERGSRGGVAYTRYTFDLDGPALAARMRDRLQRQMTARGELPAGVPLALPELYAGMTGRGDLWLDQDGLPLRQYLSLHFPESGDERVSADVDVTFSGFGAAPTTAGILGAALKTAGLLSAPAEWLATSLADRDAVRALAGNAGLFGLLTGLFLMLVGSSRSRRLSSAITVACLVALVVTPLLQGVQAAHAESARATQRALQQAAAEESEMQQRLRSFLTEPGADNPSSPATAPGDPSLQPPAAQNGDLLDQLLLDAASTADSDRDGLTDYQESLLGTDPFRADSDGDLLPDKREVEGFEHDGRRWVTDPLALDSNRDGLSDTREWLADVDGDGLPDDTDGDGVPDLLDSDNDGDGVPDRQDISPFAVGASFTGDDPLALTFANLASERPTLVDFQLRPADADHLWYAFNVLDWPEGDAEGQMQDVDGRTFADVSGRDLMGQEADGDLRLVPMLEIEIDGPLTHLPTAVEQKQMGMVVQTPRDEQGRRRADRPTHVYLPLRLVTDPDSGAQVAFEGKMLYRPEFDLWGSAHRVRLAWLVQALVDVCVDAAAGDVPCDEAQNNQPQVLHVYYEPWQLTGLDVREDHGVEMAILFEDPSLDPEPHDDDALMMLAGGLAQTFLAGRDADGDGQPDLTTAEIARRFALDSDVSDVERWSIPDVVDVTRRTYEHRAQALATVAMTDTARILAERFTPHVERSGAITPTLMFAREERFRAVNLDSHAATDLVTWRESSLTVDLNPDQVSRQTLAGLSWAPYRYSDVGQRWESFAVEEYWDVLAARYPFFEESDPETAAGKQFALQLFYLSLYAGVSETITFAGAIPPDLQAASDRALSATILDYALNGVSYVINGYVRVLLDVGRTVDGFTWSDWARVKELVTRTNQELRLLARDLKAKFRSLSTFGKGAVIAAVILLLAGLILLIVFSGQSLAARITLASIVGGLLLWIDVISPVYSVIQGVRGFVTAETGFLSAARSWLATSSGQSFVNAAKFAAVLALIISLVVIWVDFFVTINRHDFQAGSIPFNLLLSQAIAGTLIAALALALVFAFPIAGAIIVAVVGIWDLIMTIVGLDHLVLTNQVTRFLADVFYGVDATIDEPDVTLQSRDLALVDPRRGVAAGNRLSVSATVLTEIEHNRPGHNVFFYRNTFYVPDYLATTTFDYRLHGREGAAGQPWSPPGPWRLNRAYRHQSHWLWRGERESVVPAVSLPLTGAGVNRVTPYDFDVRYDLPGWECWGVSALAYCDERRITGENGTVDATIVLDVFPATLDQFYALDWGAWQPEWNCPPAPTADEYRYWEALGSRCDHGRAFPPQRDHDGDGLLARSTGGLDPDDTRWDADGDTLSDRFELELAEQGQGLALHLSADSDGDGLCDDQELSAGSDPGLADSDGDGLLDGEEVFHQDRCDGDGDGDTTEWLGGWPFVYDVARPGGSPQTTIVSSDPRQADGDGDGLGDLAEKRLHELNPLLYPYHPAVYNETPVALYSRLGDADRVLAPGQTVAYTATVRNALPAPLYSAGALTVTLPGSFGGESLTTPFNLYREQEEVISRDIGVPAGASSAEVAIGQVVNARLHGGDLAPLFSWLPPQVTPFSFSGDLPPVSMAIAAPGPSWPASHIVAVLRGRDEPGPCGGDIPCATAAVELLSVAAGGRVTGTLTVDAFRDFADPVAGLRPDLAFSGVGPGDSIGEAPGLLVYSRPYCEGEGCSPAPTVMGALLTPDSEPVPFPISRAASADAPPPGVENVQVAADAAGFLVLWQETDSDGDGNGHPIRTVRVTAAGTVSPAQTLALANPETVLDLAWTGDGYLLAWSAAPAADGRPLRLTALAGEGQLQATADYELAPSLPPAAQAHIAAAPAAGRALVLYGASGASLAARLLSAGALSPELTLWDGEDVAAPRVAYDPAAGGWLASWLAPDPSGEPTLYYQALDRGGQPRLARQSRPLAAPVSPVSGADLACAQHAAGCLAVLLEASELELVSLALDPLTTVIDRPLSLLVDADPPTSTVTSLQDGGYISATGELVVGGLAADPTSRVAAVDVSVDGNPCREVVGAAVWAATCRVPDVDGPFTITSQAGDVAGNRQPLPGRSTVILDRRSPRLTVAEAAAGRTVAAQAAGGGRWLLPLAGQALDPAAGSAPGSGVARVEARLAWDRTWQQAELDGGAWRLDYRLPLYDAAFNLLADPTGRYTFTLRAVDTVGNVTQLPDLVIPVDNQPPLASVTTPAAADGVISRTLTLSGRLTETGAVRSGLSALSFALTEADFVISPTTWLPAQLAQSGPGVISTTWSAAVPSALEGVYRLDVRGADFFGNGNDDRSTWNQWQGEIDTLAPRTAVTVTYSGAGSSAQTHYRFWAEDFNLASTNFASLCPAAAVTGTTYSSAWWDEVIGDRTRLYSRTTACRVTDFQSGAVTAEACDRFGRCTLAAGAPSAASLLPLVHSAVLTPAHRAVLADDAPVTLTVGAHAADGLAAAALRVDGAPQASRRWDDAPVDDVWSTAWQPPGEGAYLLTSVVTDTLGRVQTDTVATLISVDLAPPQLSLATAVVTATHRLAAGRVDLTGIARDAVGVTSVAVQIDGGPWQPAVLHGEEWIFPWQLGADLDGQTFDVAVRAADGAGRIDELRRQVTVDVVPPDPVDVELELLTAGASRPLLPGATVRETPARLAIGWAAAADGGGSDHYLAGWSPHPAPGAAELTRYAAPARHEQSVAGPQALYAHLLIRDENGNTTAQRLGPVVVDGPGTPDYVVDLAYAGWQDDATTLVAVDRAMSRRAATGATLNAPQRLYASWDAAGLRLTWTGASWNRDGDLFLYLDTAPGGARQLYNPYDGPNPTITLPDDLSADVLVHVEDGRGATLRRWDGDAWAEPAALSGEQFASDPVADTVARPPRTDFYLPFDLLSVADPGATGLKLLAVASEEEALRLWAALPDKNPLNSERAIDPAAVPFATGDFQLTQFLAWAALGDGQIPNGGAQPGADLQLAIAADPPGVALSYLASGLPQLQPGARLDQGLDGRLDPSLPLTTEPAPLADGAVVTYTITYANLGDATAADVQLEVAGYGALLLPQTAPRQVDLGDLAPGISGTVMVTATVGVSQTQNIASAELDVTVSDRAHGPFDWLWVQHDLDVSPPQVSILAPQSPISYGPLLLRGAVDGPAAVADVTIAIQTWLTGTQALTFCTGATIDGGRWSCTWQPPDGDLATTVFDGAELVVQARATDVFGRRSDWTEPLTLVVDRQAPRLVLSAETTAFLADGLLNASELNLTGVISDARRAGQLELCLDADPCRRIDTLDGAWHVPVAAPAEADGLAQTMTLQGFDAAGNPSPPTELDYRIDVRPPTLSVTNQLTTVLQSAAATTVLTGTVQEGSGPPTVTVRVLPPTGPARVQPLALSGSAWSFALTPTVAGRHYLILEAQDRAGNVRILPAVSLIVAPAPMPPTSGPSPPVASTQISRDYFPNLTAGGFIRLVVEPDLPEIWSQVQWRDAAGRWHDVDGWGGAYYRDNEVLWWVSPRDLGTGPYRWVVYQRRGGPVHAYSAPFLAPARTGQQVTVRLIW